MTGDRFSFRPTDFLPVDLQEVDREVFVAPCLRPEAAARLLAEVDRRMALGVAEASRRDPGAMPTPNTMHDHGVMLDGLGLTSVVDDLLDSIPGLRGLLAQRFGEVGGATIDDHHSYLVDYGREGDEELGFHVDDSEVTLNLCLGEAFSGAELVMMGRRCDLHRQTAVMGQEEVEILHEPGSLVIHAGRHRHRVDPIRRGRRRNLIAWLRSSSYRKAEGGRQAEAECPVWCGWERG